MIAAADRIVVLKAPSDSLLAWRITDPHFWRAFLQDLLIQQELGHLIRRMKDLARPLAYAKDVAGLERSLAAQMPIYVLWKGEYYNLILNSINKSDPTEFLNSYSDINRQARKSLEDVAPLYLREEDIERLLSAAYGVSIYSENLIGIILQEGPQALDPDVVKATIGNFLMADLLMLTAALIMDRQLRHWTPRSWLKPTLALISQQAETYVDAIENDLLIRNPEFRRRMEHPPGTAISLEESRKQLGLR